MIIVAFLDLLNFDSQGAVLFELFFFSSYLTMFFHRV